jgi:uncharacterized membrane protein
VFLAIVYAVAIIVSFIPNFVNKLVLKDSHLLGGILILGSFLISLIIQLDLIKIAFKFCDGGRGVYNDLLSSYKLLLKYLAAKILYTLIVISGTLLLIVPGIIWAVKYSFYAYIIVDDDAGPIEALKKSSRITKGARWDLFVFGIIILAINVAGFICFGIGALITLPITQLAFASVYRKLSPATPPVQVPPVVTELISEG